MPEAPRYTPGGDQAAIARIAGQVFGNYEALFSAHGWPWPGTQAMNQAATRIKERYGSIAAFERQYDMGQFGDPFQGDPQVWITSYWGWAPETWGCVGFTEKGRRETFLKEVPFPFLMVVYVTENAPRAPACDLGRVTGFYEVFNLPGDRRQFTAEIHHALEDDKWRYSLKALRAFEILPEFRPHIRDFDPSILNEKRSQSVAKHGAKLAGDVVDRLKALPLYEVPVFGVSQSVRSEIFIPSSTAPKNNERGFVSGGASRTAGYEVGEPKDTEKELYILKLSGDPEVFLGRACAGRSIYKVGLSISPDTRAKSFNHGMLQGAFQWDVIKSTTRTGDARYPNFGVAEKGEMAMKTVLGKDSELHLGGEFYLANEEEIEHAWMRGRNVALEWKAKTDA